MVCTLPVAVQPSILRSNWPSSVDSWKHHGRLLESVSIHPWVVRLVWASVVRTRYSDRIVRVCVCRNESQKQRLYSYHGRSWSHATTPAVSVEFFTLSASSSSSSLLSSSSSVIVIVVVAVVVFARTEWAKKVSYCIACCNFVNCAQLLQSLLNLQKDARNICYLPSKCYHFTLQNGKQCKGAYGV